MKENKNAKTNPKLNTLERQSFKDATSEERNLLAKQYEPLMNKLTGQMYKCTGMNWQDLYSMAEYGFAMAINNFDPEKSKMKFTQYAAWSIRNHMLTCISEQKNVVSLSGYAVTKIRERGESISKTVGISESTKGTSCSYSSNVTGDPIEGLCDELSEKFSKQDMYLFKSFYGLGDIEQKSATQLAKEQKVTVGAISQKTRKIVNYIKNNDELREYVAELL